MSNTEGALIEGEIARNKGGRPKGSKNKPKTSPTRPPIARASIRDTRPDPDHATPQQVRPSPARDSVREAEEYAIKLMDQWGENIDHSDEFYVDKRVIPDGWTYQWRRLEMIGKQDKFYMNELKQRGWREVPGSRHPDMVPEGWGDQPIVKKGLILMELPTILVERSQGVEKREAETELQNAQAALTNSPRGTAPRDDPSVKKHGLNKLESDWYRQKGTERKIIGEDAAA